MELIDIICIAGSIIFFIVVIDFVRRGLLKEKYSVLWLITIFVMAVLAFYRRLIDKVASFVGIDYGPSLLFLVLIFFIVLILFHYSVVISVLTDKNKILAQEVALLKEEMKK